MLLLRQAKESSRHSEMDSYEERIVYQHVEEAGNTGAFAWMAFLRPASAYTAAAALQGIWTKHLRMHTGIEKAQFTKVIKKLENKKLIKSVNSVSVRDP